MNISVVIPLYNKEKHIQHTIDTVLNQNFKDFELIVIDDGSTDRSGEMVKAIKDKRIKYIRQDNKGETYTRNYGVSCAKNNFIAFIDADDEWKPDFLNEISRLIEKYPYAGLFATKIAVHERNGKEYSLNYPNISSEENDCLIDNYFISAYDYSPISSSSVCVKKECFEEIEGFIPDIKNGGDLDLWSRMALKYKFAFSNKVLAVYRRDSENMMSRSNINPSYFPFLDNYKKEDNVNNINESSIEKYILQKQLSAASVSIFVNRNKAQCKDILSKARFIKWNYKKYIAFRIISNLPQSLIDKLYKIKTNVIKK